MQFSKWALRYKLMVPILSAVIVLSAISSLYIIQLVENEYREEAYQSMEHLAAKVAGDISSITDDSITTAITLASTVEALTQEGSQIPRDSLMSMLVNIQKENKNLYGVWANWLPGQYDGMDGMTEEGNKFMSDGHFAPMAFPDGSGGISRITTTGHTNKDKQGL